MGVCSGLLDSRWTRVAVFATLILVGTACPSPLRRHPAFRTVGPDKLLHLAGHAGLAASLADALAAGRLDARESAIVSVGASTGLSLLSARLQKRVPGRVPERADVAAAVIGSLVGVLGWQSGCAGGDGPIA